MSIEDSRVRGNACNLNMFVSQKKNVSLQTTLVNDWQLACLKFRMRSDVPFRASHVQLAATLLLFNFILTKGAAVTIITVLG